LILARTARPESDLRFEPSIPAGAARRWEADARRLWPTWETRFGIAAPRPALRVVSREAPSLPDDLGRTRGGLVELNASLPHGASDAVFRHELAHVFFESACPGLAAKAPVLSEAFALHASGDAARRLATESGYPSLPVARDRLVSGDASPGAGGTAATAATARALVRVLGRAGQDARWDGVFARVLGTCRDDSFSTSAALVVFRDAVREEEPAPVARTDFLLLDGLSGETLAEDGRPDARFPTGSILKPSLVAFVPALLAPRPARDDAAWRCPRAIPAGEEMDWATALRRSCNGFFLDAGRAGADFAGWEGALSALGLPEPPRTMEGRIGLLGDYAVSPREAVRLFAWLERAAPHVLDALRRTASDGTLAGAPDAAWFTARGIALKTGTVRDAKSAPEHAWIVAVGPRTAGGPEFVAAIHATGRATSSLLPDLKRRLEAALTFLETPSEVQVLGLVPPSALAVGCDADVPLAVRTPDGRWRLEENASRTAAPEPGAAYACPAARLSVTFPDKDGARRIRRYAGTLRVDAEPAPAHEAGLPLRAKSARARAGSRFVLETSLLSFVTSSLLSEAPAAHTEVLKALALVVRNDRATRRHGDRPPCDTTHCHLFGHDEDVPAAARKRARAAVRETADVEIVPPEGGRVWLPFSLGGRAPWTEARPTSEVREELGLAAVPAALTRSEGGAFRVDGARAVPCEVLRNQLRLPSCPESVATEGGAFVFHGRGEGHGEGLDLTAANAAAAEGVDFRTLLARAFPGLALGPAR
jgi:hypothetical protein